MKRTTRVFVVSLSLALVFLSSASRTWAEIDVGDYTISGSAEVDGLPRGFNGDRSKFEEYRIIPESVVVPQLQLMLGGKKQDFYLNFDAGGVGRDDQNYRLRFGRYGLFDVELEWDQIPHVFDIGNARTPYVMRDGTYTLPVRPTAGDISSLDTTLANPFNTWINANARSVDLDMLNKIGKISIRYTPTPGWTFIGKYWSQQNDGKRAIAFPFGSNSNASIAELAEPIDYQTHNIELGGEYAGKGWSLGLKYNGSIFHNNISTLVFDNPAAAGPGCADAATIDFTTGAGPCRGRVDLYPSNQAHTFTLTGTANLPLKTNFLGTVSYGWRIQDDPFLPSTINSAIANPTLSRKSLEGDVRPAMVNMTLVNNFIDNLNLKAYYRFYDLDSYTASVSTSGTVRNDQSTGGPDWTTAHSYQYSKNSAGVGAAYNFTRWLTGKFNFSWDGTHRSIPAIDGPNQTLNAHEFKFGPTFDIKPLSWLLFRTSYQHSWRDAPGYPAEDGRRKFFLAKREQDKASLFTDVSPWETLSFHAGFDFINDNYPDTTFGVQNARNYSPSVGVLYAPLEWLRFFADYNFDWSVWNQVYDDTRTSRGTDKINTFSLGSDVDIIKDLLGFRVQYGLSQGLSKFRNRNTPNPGVEDPNWPNNTNTWQELLARLEYKLHKNVAVQLGYYFNRFHSKDFGVDIMKLWMGDQDNVTPAAINGQLRSIYLGDQFKGSYTAHIAILGLKLKF
jgi:MtrB/PioB family decaheme-associated outer membrane protein